MVSYYNLISYSIIKPYNKKRLGKLCIRTGIALDCNFSSFLVRKRDTARIIFITHVLVSTCDFNRNQINQSGGLLSSDHV